jgi:hypothetical protein
MGPSEITSEEASLFFQWSNIDPPRQATKPLLAGEKSPAQPATPAGKDPSASGTESEPPTEPTPGGKTVAASVSATLPDIVAELRKRRARTRAALVEFMVDRNSAPFEEIGHHVHGDSQTSDDAISKNVERTNESLIAMGVPLRFSVAASYVFKEEQPE